MFYYIFFFVYKKHFNIIIFFSRVEYIQLAADYKPAVNLGQGFPDYHAPDHVRKALSDIAIGENPLLNQYTRGFVSELFSTSFIETIEGTNV